ncbi:class I glutamine amidotransferase-like protein [Xylariaceae sp. FL0804]|nr:class I glutamine amidotransferase-like protein [Xylariaceae sp. FL0804]
MTIDTCTRVAVFECLTLADNISQVRGQFGDVFAAWLNRSAAAYNETRPRADRIEIETTSWNVVEGRYPPALSEIDAIIVTGSTASAYDHDDWIRDLSTYLTDAYQDHPHVRLFGGCFGHQLIVQALLARHGARVEKSPHGWEIGVQPVTLDPGFREHFAQQLRGASTMSCQFLHADHTVLSPTVFARGWVSLGDSPLCGVQGVYKPGRVLTFQGHPEFDAFLNEQGVRNLEKSGVLDGEQVQAARREIHRKDDAVLHGEILIEFILRNGPEETSTE